MAQFYTLEEAARVLGMGPEELKLKAQRGTSAPSSTADRGGSAWPTSRSWPAAAAWGPTRTCRSRTSSWRSPTDSGDRDLDLSEFQLGMAKPNPSPKDSGVVRARRARRPLRRHVAPALARRQLRSTIIGMRPSHGKMPSDSDVRLVPENSGSKGTSDSDVRLAPASPRGRQPSDSDVTLVSGSDSA